MAGPFTRPVLLYYSLLNLVKAIVLHKNPSKNLARALHGMNEPYGNIRKHFTLTSQKLVI